VDIALGLLKEFIKGKFKELPAFKFKSDLRLGFMMFLKSIPFIAVYAFLLLVLGAIAGFLGIQNQELFVDLINMLLALFVIPMLVINFINKQTIDSYFELEIIKSVFNNFGDYVLALLKNILLSIIFLIMWIILVGLPAGTFTKIYL